MADGVRKIIRGDVRRRVLEEGKEASQEDRQWSRKGEAVAGLKAGGRTGTGAVKPRERTETHSRRAGGASPLWESASVTRPSRLSVSLALHHCPIPNSPDVFTLVLLLAFF